MRACAVSGDSLGSSEASLGLAVSASDSLSYRRQVLLVFLQSAQWSPGERGLLFVLGWVVVTEEAEAGV